MDLDKQEVLLNIPPEPTGAGSEGFSFPLEDQRYEGVHFPEWFLGSLTAKELWLSWFKRDKKAHTS